MKWTPTRDKQLTDLWRFGETSGQIADAMGITRSAVMGRVYRLGLRAADKPRRKSVPKGTPKSTKKGKAAKAAKPIAPALRKQAPVARMGPKTTGRFGFDLSTPDMQAPRPEPELPKAADAATGAPVTLMDLRDCHCKFPLTAADGSTVYCGNKAPSGTSWCEAHRKVVFKPLAARNNAAGEKV